EATAGNEFPLSRTFAKPHGIRTHLAAPLLSKGAAIGAILIRRLDVRPFTSKQITLLTTFADQAVIAIGEVRLFNQTKKALERQTATSEILQVISQSPTDTQPVFEAIVERALRLSEATVGGVMSTVGPNRRTCDRAAAGHRRSAQLDRI